MKKLVYTIIAFLGIHITLNAQIVLTEADYGKVSSSIIQNRDTLPLGSIAPGASGANVTWNFVALHNHSSITNSFIAPSSGLLGTSFPMTNVCINEGNVNYIYLDTSNTAVTLWGYTGDLLQNSINQALVLNNPETVITFPSTYNTAFLDTAFFDRTYYYGAYCQGIYVDSLREKQILYISSIMDGWGTVMAPGGSSPCLRQNILKHTIDSTWAEITNGGNPYWINVTGRTWNTQSYSYISNTIGGGPVVDIQFYPDSNAILEVKWNAITPGGITLTEADYANVGSSIIQVTDTFPNGGITPGSSGANVTWNFTLLKADVITTNTFIAPGSGVLGASYPMTNVCINQGNKNYIYLDTSNTAVKLWGYVGDLLQNSTMQALVLNNPETMITFPSMYNTTFLDTASYDQTYYYGALYQGIYVDSLREKQTDHISSVIDGWGTVITPNGSYPCLRQNVLKQAVDSTWAKVTVGNYHYWYNVSGSASTTQSYSYISDAVGGGPVVDIQYYTDSNAIFEIKWRSSVPLEQVNHSAPILTFYPNPASSCFYINNTSGEKQNAIIYDLSGREVLTTGTFSEQKKMINTNNIESGTYVIKIVNNDGTIQTDKIVIIH